MLTPDNARFSQLGHVRSAAESHNKLQPTVDEYVCIHTYNACQSWRWDRVSLTIRLESETIQKGSNKLTWVIWGPRDIAVILSTQSQHKILTKCKSRWPSQKVHTLSRWMWEYCCLIYCWDHCVWTVTFNCDAVQNFRRKRTRPHNQQRSIPLLSQSELTIENLQSQSCQNNAAVNRAATMSW